jgi:NADPH-dependent curcumin reductase CurA
MTSRVLVPQIQSLVRLMKRPKGRVVPGVDLVLDDKAPVPLPSSLQPGEILVRNLFLSLDPAMRGWMNEGKSYVPPVPLGDVMRGGAIGAVVHSMNDKFSRGDLVSGLFGWCEYAVASKALVKLPLDFPLHNSTAYLGVLGMPGLTAYFGTFEVMRPKAGDTVVVSAAAGAVGSVVVSLAKRIVGCRVVAIAGGSEKCAWLKEKCGADVVIDYKNKETFMNEFKAATSTGVDCYFDNVRVLLKRTARKNQ